jgi:hypothetical protein
MSINLKAEGRMDRETLAIHAAFVLIGGGAYV